MSLIIDGVERNTLIINKNVYKFDHIWSPEPLINMSGANAQNAKYRGKNLGAFTEDYATKIKNGVFDSMQVGDTFTQNGHTYKIGGFNYLCGAEQNPKLGNHLIMVTGQLGRHAMNPSETNAGGFAGSDMWKTYFPTIVNQLKADFGNHLLTWNEFLTTDTDGNAANQGKYFAVQASMMNTVMYWGSPSKYSPSSGGKNWNTGIENRQLPIMKLHPDEQKNGGQFTWQRDIFANEWFAGAAEDGTESFDVASDSEPYVRAFFLID